MESKSLGEERRFEVEWINSLEEWSGGVERRSGVEEWSGWGCVNEKSEGEVEEEERRRRVI